MTGRIDKASAASDAPIDWESIPFPPNAVVETSRLAIRPLHIKDAERMAELANDERILKWMANRFPFPYQTSHAEWFINHFGGPPPAGQPYIQFALALKDEPEKFIGCMGLHPGGDVFCRSAEFGWWMGFDHHGHGYMTEAAKVVESWAFALENGLKGVEGESLMHIAIHTYGSNKASQRVAEKLGYGLEGVSKCAVWKAGKLDNLVMFGKCRNDWEKERNLKSTDE
jgi:[ribosomal protein S5]-alanine N-acetyltransferase